MVVHVFKTPEELAQAAAMVFAAQIAKKPDTVLGLATGSTPVGTYRELARLNRLGLIDFSEVRTYNLDEYIGLEPTHDQSYRYFMNDNLFNHINIKMENTHVPCGTGADHWADARAYDEAVEAAGGIDLQLLGIGRNAHIGFNEPDDHFSKYTHQVDLTESTIAANTRFFEREEDVPRQAISMGMQAITQARKILLIASGADKADALYASCFGPVTPQVPASILQLHQDVTIIADEEALSKCPR